MLPPKDYKELCSRLNELGLKSLVEYRSSPHWRRAYDQYVTESKHECLCCTTKLWLQLHHLHYRNLGREKDRDLCWLCYKCHEFVHSYAIRNGLSVRRATQHLAYRRHTDVPTKNKRGKRKRRRSWQNNVKGKEHGRFMAKPDVSLVKIVPRPSWY